MFCPAIGPLDLNTRLLGHIGHIMTYLIIINYLIRKSKFGVKVNRVAFIIIYYLISCYTNIDLKGKNINK